MKETSLQHLKNMLPKNALILKIEKVEKLEKTKIKKYAIIDYLSGGKQYKTKLKMHHIGR